MIGLTVHIDDATQARLRQIAEELHRDVHDLASSAVAEAALDYFRGRSASRDPADLPARSTIQ